MSEESGTVLMCGGTDWDSVGRKSVHTREERPNLETPHVLRVPGNPQIVRAVTGPTSCHSVLISKDGDVYVFGRNERGQLGLGDQKKRSYPVKIPSSAFDESKVVGAATGRNHTLLITEKGQLFGMGDNKMGQLGISQLKDVLTVTAIQSINSKLAEGAKVVKVACGADFSVALTDTGVVYTFGSPEHGQLGMGSDRQYFVSASKLIFDPQPDPHLLTTLAGKKIVDIAAGTSHCLALTSDNYLYSWGFGGYGRLGHGEQKDSMYPTLVQHLGYENIIARASKIACGPTCSLVIDGQGMMYLWGKWKNTGDGGTGQSWMTPRVVPDLQGWKLKDISAGSVSLFALAKAEKTTIAWGQGAQYGELGYGEGEPKSSTKPQKVEPLEGMDILSVSGGASHTLFIAKSDDPKLPNIPLFPVTEEMMEDGDEDADEEEEQVPAKKGKAGAKRKAPAKAAPAKKAKTTAPAKKAPAKATRKKKD